MTHVKQLFFENTGLPYSRSPHGTNVAVSEKNPLYNRFTYTIKFYQVIILLKKVIIKYHKRSLPALAVNEFACLCFPDFGLKVVQSPKVAVEERFNCIYFGVKIW